MSHELFYTSAPSGIKPGSKGFCTVACTSGIPAQLMDRLESLSGYRYLYEPGSPQASQNPVSWAHWRITLQGKMRSVLSRVCDAGSDYSGRSNKFAHHVALELNELPNCGPAYLMAHEFMEKSWTGAPRVIPTGRPLPSATRNGGICKGWQKSTGDAGWAGVLAENFLADPLKPAYVIYPTDVNILALFEEAMALLPETARWQVTFNTYFTDLPAGLTCAWRGVVAGTLAAREATKQGGRALVIDLAQAGACSTQSALVEFARTGIPPVRKERPQRINEPILEMADEVLRRPMSSSALVQPHLELAGAPTSSQPNVVVVEREILIADSGRRRGIPIWMLVVSTVATGLIFGVAGILLGMNLGSQPTQGGPTPVVASPQPQSRPIIAEPDPAKIPDIASTSRPVIDSGPTSMNATAPSVSLAQTENPRPVLMVDPNHDSVPLPLLSLENGDQLAMEISLPGITRPDHGAQLFSILKYGNIPELKLLFVWERKKLNISIPKPGMTDGQPVATLSFSADKSLNLIWSDNAPENDPTRRQCASLLTAATLNFLDGAGTISKTQVHFSNPKNDAEKPVDVGPGNVTDSFATPDVALNVPLNGLRVMRKVEGKQVSCPWSDDAKTYPGKPGYFRCIIGVAGPEKPVEFRCPNRTVPLAMHSFFFDFLISRR